MDYNKLLDPVVKIAHQAGKAIMRVYKKDFEVAYKRDQSPLTEADIAAHRVIVKKLKALTPEIPILSEEDCASFPGPNAAQQYWLVDPLDGTKEFVKKNGEFTVNIALICEGKPVIGVVFAPALGVTYLAAKDFGAYKEEKGVRESIHACPRMPEIPCRVVGSRSHATPALEDWLARLGEYTFIPMGSSLKLCLVAENRADLYPRLGPTYLWDTAAAQCIVEEADALVIDLEGVPLSYENPSEMLNPYFVVTVNAAPMMP